MIEPIGSIPHATCCDECRLARFERDRAIETRENANTVSVREQARNSRLEVEVERLRAALELIAAPARPDGSWNRDRAACQQIAQAALDGRFLSIHHEDET